MERVGLLLALLVVLAGCSAGYQGATPAGTETPTTPATATPAPDGATGPGGVDGAGDGPTGTDDGAAGPPPDPASDRLGWEDGYWYNESVPVAAGDGFNESERRAVVARTMARVEHIRRLEFEQRVPVEVVSRETYRRQYAGGNATYTPAFRAFDNAKFEALFLVGEDNDSLATQNQNRGSNVLGFYSPREDSIVLVSESDPPDLPGELTLAHELAHALQDQQFNISRYRAPTREVYAAHNGLIEGDAHYVEQRYRVNCEAEVWECVSPSSSESESGDEDGDDGPQIHLGVYILNYFPYSDGPGFVGYHYRQGGWERVNRMYDPERLPASTAAVVRPRRYGEFSPTNVTLADRTRGEWRRVRPESPRPGQARPAYATLGMSGLTAMFAYTLYDEENESGAVIAPAEFLNVDGNQINRSDPFEYGIAPVEGWVGDRMHVYWRGADPVSGTAYVWKLAWTNESEAAAFADAYRRLLDHYGAEQRSCDGGGGAPCTYVIESGPYADAFRVTVDGDTVVVVNAPSVAALDDVRAPDGSGTA